MHVLKSKNIKDFFTCVVRIYIYIYIYFYIWTWLFKNDYNFCLYFRKLSDSLYLLLYCLKRHVWDQQFKDLVELWVWNEGLGCDQKDFRYSQLSHKKIKRHSRALAIILNMFDSFKQEVLDALTTMFYPIYDMDPLHLLANKQITNNRLSYIGSNLWEEQSTFIE